MKAFHEDESCLELSVQEQGNPKRASKTQFQTEICLKEAVNGREILAKFNRFSFANANFSFLGSLKESSKGLSAKPLGCA